MKKLISMVTVIALMATSLLCSLSMNVSADDVIKVACVGDSITGGNPGVNYPEYLQAMLGDGYEVQNFGKGGAAVHKVLENTDANGDGVINEGGEYFWYDSPQYLNSIEYEADYVLVMMGTNDGLASNFAVIDDYYVDEYKALIQPYIDAGSKVIVMTSPYAYQILFADISNVNVYIRGLQLQIAEELGLDTVDINTATANRNESFPDNIHGNASGYMIIAETVYKEVFGGEVYTLTAQTGEAASLTLTSDNPDFGNYVLNTDENGYGTIPVLPGTYSAEIKCGIYTDTIENIVVDGDLEYTFEYSTDNVNYAIGATVTVDSVHVDHHEYQGNCINDGNTLTRWQSNSTGKDAANMAWLEMEFTEPTTFDNMVVFWETARPSASGTAAFISDDGENWTSIEMTWDEGVDLGNATVQQTFNFDPVTTKYLRLEFSEMYDKYDCPSIWELELYNTSNVGGDSNPPDDDNPVPTSGKGDVNGDGEINSTDFMQVRRHFLDLFVIPEDKQDAADVNSDGTINSTDFMQIRRHFLGLYTIGE